MNAEDFLCIKCGRSQPNTCNCRDVSSSTETVGYASLTEKYNALRVAAMTLADEADDYQEDEGDRQRLDDAINAVYRITGI